MASVPLNLSPSTKELSQFGWISLVGFPAFGLLFSFVIGEGLLPLWVGIAVGVAVCGLARIDPKLIKWVFVGLMLIAWPVGLVVSTVMMAMIYYLLMTPVGLAFRLLGKDPLAKRPDPSAVSYWHLRTKPPSPASYLRLY